MRFQPVGAMIELCILAALENEDLYGYRLTAQVGVPLGLSESTLYPVLRRLKNEGCLEVYDRGIDGRNRRYYRLTGFGKENLERMRNEWSIFKAQIDQIADGRKKDES